MRKLRLPVALLTLSLLCVSGCFLFLGAQAFTTFLPPRTAVVDISKIFDSYQKQIDKSGELKVAFDKAKREELSMHCSSMAWGESQASKSQLNSSEKTLVICRKSNS